jgi:hypothetical protein
MPPPGVWYNRKRQEKNLPRGNAMADGRTVDNLVLNGLGRKLESLDLTPPEKAALDAVFERAANFTPEVEGFGVVYEIETTFKGSDEELQLTGAGQRLGRALGFHIHVNPFIGETEKNLR